MANPQTAEMATITKRDLVREVSNKTGLTQSQTYEVLQEAFDMIIFELARANTVVVRNFGTFEVTEAKAKVGRNPKDPSNPVPIPARAVAKFKAGKEMKEKVARVLPLLQKS
ncbi:MAG: HU family DNA-binding protein [Verrucomicrobiales bacterium]